MASRIELCLEGLPRFETSPFFCSLEPSTESALKQLPNAYERATAALRFRQNIGGDKATLGVSEDHVDIMQVAYLRAALMEYVAIEEVLPIDLSLRSLEEETLRIFETGNVNILCKVGARTHEALIEAMAEALSAVTPWDAAGWFDHCGYEVEVLYL